MSTRILLENQKPGTPKSIWDAPASNQIEGFATDFSVDNGASVSFKINLNLAQGATAPFRIEIYRLGYYGGDGATHVTTLNNLTGVRQPNPLVDSRGVADAGNWSVSASWTTPPDAVSGVYLAKLVRLDNGATNQIPFIVRDDTTPADIVLQTSDTTWQAYNGWAGRNGQVGGSLYGGFDQPANIAPDQAPSGQDRAFGVSYNRPFITRDGGGTFAGPQDYLFGADYAAIHWLEENGFDVSYISGIDTDRLGADYLEKYKAYISVGHDEYWSGSQRANVEGARDVGVNLLFWSGNEVYWKTRWEPSIVDGQPFRTLISYKETKFNYSLDAGPEDYPNVDPSAEWTGTWRDLRFAGNPNAVGAIPENALTGQLFGPDGTGEFGGALDIPAAYAGLRVWRGAGVGPNGAQNIAPGILGYEWDTSPSDAFRPPGLIKLSETTLAWSAILTDQGNRTSPGTATHNLSLYRDDSGALVFGAGTVFWAWGLSNEHDSSPYGANIENRTIQQFTLNMFADMGIQPQVADAVLQAQGLVRASASNDKIAATTTLNNLSDTVTLGSTVSISGSAADVDNNPANDDGRVAIVEVSVDNGQTWRLAQGTSTWSFSWTPTAPGAYTIRARAVDDSLNVLPNAQLANDVVTVTAPPTPETVSLFGPQIAPSGSLFNDGAAVELGMKFRASEAGSITHLRYFRATADANDTDVREGHLWTSGGSLLATATFNSGPGQAGWQVAALSAPISIQANTTYVVSYKTANNYLSAGNYFTNTVTEPSGILSAPASGQISGNGVYIYGSSLQFPNQTFEAANYWADVIFDPAGGAPPAPPTFTSPASFSVPENSTTVGTVTASDPNADVLTFALAGGADAARFSISAQTGQLRFLTAPDFEAPQDQGGDNTYAVTVSVTDGSTPPVQQALTVTVTNVAEPAPGPGSFAGRSIRADYIFGATAQTVAPYAGSTQTATVNATQGAVEFANLPNPDPASVGNGQFGLATVDLAEQTLVIQFPLDPAVFSQAFVPFATAQTAPFNGVRLTDADGALAAIRGFSIVSQRGFTNQAGADTPLTAGDFTLTSEALFLNMAGKGRRVDADPAAAGAQPSQIVLSVDLNDSPVADAETLATPRNSALQIPVATLLAGDTDADGDALLLTLVRNPTNGTVSLDTATNTVTFTPALGFTGTASFEYVVTDGFGGSATGAVTVNVVDPGGNSPPTVTPIDAGVTNEDAAPVQINLLAGASDPNGDPLSVQNASLTSSNSARTVAFTLSPAGLLTLNLAQFDNLPQGASETVTVAYSVSDGVNSVANTASLVVQGRNDTPVAANDAYTTGETGVLAGNVISNPAGLDTDPDANPLSVVAVNGLAGAVGASVVLASGARLTMNASGAFSYDPNGAFDGLAAGQQATDSFTYGVSDGLATSTATVTVTVNGADTVNLVLTGNNNANTLIGAAGDDSLSGLGGADQLSGNGGRDTLNGGSGNDTLEAGAGDDLLLIRGTEAQFDLLGGGDGADTVRIVAAGGAATLGGTGQLTGVEIFDGAGQAVRGNGSANLLDFSGFTSVVGVTSILGLGGSDTLIGTAGGDTLEGGGAADQVSGGSGDDVLLIRGTEGQSDNLAGGDGADILRVVAAGGAASLASTAALSGIEFLDGSGQNLQGTSGANLLDLSGFAEVTGVAAILGLGGSDTIIGAAGADVLVGGSGADRLTGGAGDDVFRYLAFNDSPSNGRDVIVEMTGAGAPGGDVIDVSALSAGAFVFNGTGAFTGGGTASIRYVVSGGVTDVLFDSGNGGGAEMVVRINAIVSLTSADFVL